MSRGLILLPLLALLQSCAIFNSGTLHVKYTRSKAKFDGVSYQNKERFRSLSFSIRNVQHPSLYAPWAVSVSLDPSVHLDRQLYGTLATTTDASGRTTQLPDIEIRRLSAFSNLKIVGHTPIGQFALSGGYGLGATRYDDNGALQSLRARSIRKLDLAYIGFFANRFFFMMGPRYYRTYREEYIFALRVGMFWGPIKRKKGWFELFSAPH